MPFTKLGHGRYGGPSGRTFNLAQVRLYYAGGGKFPGQDKKAAKHMAAGHPKSRTPRRHPHMKG